MDMMMMLGSYERIDLLAMANSHVLSRKNGHECLFEQKLLETFLFLLFFISFG